MAQDEKLLRMKDLAAKYMQLKKRSDDIERELGADTLAKYQQPDTAIEHHMQEIFNGQAIANVVIDGISPNVKTKEAESKIHDKFQHMKVL